MKDNNNYGLEKIPNNEIIKQLRIELGKKESYIQELKHELGINIGKKVKSETISQQENRIRNLEKELKSYRMKELMLNGKDNDLNHWCSYNGINKENKRELLNIIKNIKVEI